MVRAQLNHFVNTVGDTAQHCRFSIQIEFHDDDPRVYGIRSPGQPEAKAQVQTELDGRANQIVDRAMWQAGAAAALSPLPAIDLAAGLGITSNMVLQLARVYRQKVDLDTISRLLAELGKQLVSVAGANVAAPAAAAV